LSLSSTPSGTSGAGRLGIIRSSLAQVPATAPVASVAARSRSPSARLFSVSASAVACPGRGGPRPPARRGSFTFGAQRLGLLEELTVLDVEGDDLVHLLVRDPATGQRGLHDVRFTTQLDQVNHLAKPTEQRSRSKNRLGSRS
jgi:hypothetical protein